MRKLLMSLIAAAGLALLGTAPASAGAATTLARDGATAATANSAADQVHWRRHHRRGWGGLYFGFGAPFLGYGYYPRYRYYDDYDYYDYPRDRYYNRGAYYRGGWHYRKFRRHRHRH